jgi:hypothetical protein
MAYLAGSVAAGFMNAIVFTRATKTSTPSGGRLFRAFREGFEHISALQEGFSRTGVQKAVQALRSAREVIVAGALPEAVIRIFETGSMIPRRPECDAVGSVQLPAG